MNTACRAEQERQTAVVQPRGKPHAGQRLPSNSRPHSKQERHPRHGPWRWMQLILSGPSAATTPQNGQTAEGCRREQAPQGVQVEVSARRP
jgi:hypothetical protein